MNLQLSYSYSHLVINTCLFNSLYFIKLNKHRSFIFCVNTVHILYEITLHDGAQNADDRFPCLSILIIKILLLHFTELYCNAVFLLTSMTTSVLHKMKG